MPDSLILLRLLLDCGMLVLIWLVQLIIYPSFKYFSNVNLKRWHKKYMQVSPIVIIPLMMGQFILTALHCYYDQNNYTIISLLMVLVLWLHTFYQFVPLHNALKSIENPSEITSKLISYNWWRTIMWSILFIYGYAIFVLSD